MSVETAPTTPESELMRRRVRAIFLDRGAILSHEKESIVTEVALLLDEKLSNETNPRALNLLKNQIVTYAIEMSANFHITEAQRLRPDIKQISPFHE